MNLVTLSKKSLRLVRRLVLGEDPYLRDQLRLTWLARRYLASHPRDAEQEEVFAWLHRHLASLFPYDFVFKYEHLHVPCDYDKIAGCYTTEWHGKKLYLKTSMDEAAAATYMKNITVEQDEESPHHYRYRDDEISGKVIADLGAAEGFFGLDVVDKCKKLYLFECDPEWIAALRLTFAPWKDKVEIIPKYIDEKDDASHITLDTFCADGRPLDFVKGDIEGYEVPMLRGATKTLPRVSTFVLCTYHRQHDEEDIRAILEPAGFHVEAPRRYMLFFYDPEGFEEPYLRHALVKATRSNS